MHIYIKLENEKLDDFTADYGYNFTADYGYKCALYLGRGTTWPGDQEALIAVIGNNLTCTMKMYPNKIIYWFNDIKF